MRVEPLMSFCAVVDFGSFSEAAKALFLSQPAVSMNIKHLEQEFGQPLFIRKGKGEFELTPVGERLYSLVQGLQYHLNSIEALKQESLQQVQDRIVIETTAITSFYSLMIGKIAQFQALHPELNVSIKKTTTEQAIENLRSSGSDLLILLSTERMDEFEEVFSWEDRLELIVPNGHPFIGQFIPAKKLVEHSLILPVKHSPTRAILDKILANEGLETPPRWIMVDNTEATKQAVLSTNKPGIILNSSINQEIASGALVTVNSDLNLTCYHSLYYRKKGFVSRFTKEFIRYLQETSPA